MMEHPIVTQMRPLSNDSPGGRWLGLCKAAYRRPTYIHMLPTVTPIDHNLYTIQTRSILYGMKENVFPDRLLRLAA
jgi:hypothetical protein